METENKSDVKISRCLAVLAVPIIAMGQLPPMAPAGAGSCTRSVTASEASDVRITGIFPWQIAGLGDVNGDGYDDVMVSDQLVTEIGDTPRAYVIYGAPQPRTVNVHALATQGFTILPPDAGEGTFLDINGAGDVNGDGYDDIIVGAPGRDHNGRQFSGSAYVIFGQQDPEPVLLALWDLNEQGGRGFRIDGGKAGAIAGRFVAGLGDVNGDGLDDISVGAPFARTVYVVFGQKGNGPVDLAAWDRNEQGKAGYRIDLPFVRQSDGFALAGVDDVNGDSIPDLMVGISRRLPPDGSWVAFGKKGPAPLNAKRLRTERNGFNISDHSGVWIDGAGDFNGDGLADLLVYWEIVFGHRKPKNVSVHHKRRLGPREGIDTYADDGNASISRGAGIGDYNGDGFDDVVLGDYQSTRDGQEVAGAAYVVYGGRRTVPLRLSCLGERGFRIDGDGEADELGYQVAGGGDFNGDGLDDVAIGSVGNDLNRTANTGLTPDEATTYIFFGER